MPKRVVVDANILVKWFIPEDYSEHAAALMNDHLHGVVTAVAPSYAILEFANTLRKYVARKLLSRSDAIDALKLLEKIEVEFISITFDFLREALKYAIKKSVTVYDAYYILLAKKYGAEMFTADEKLLRKLADKERNLKHIKNYPCNHLK